MLFVFHTFCRQSQSNKSIDILFICSFIRDKYLFSSTRSIPSLFQHNLFLFHLLLFLLLFLIFIFGFRRTFLLNLYIPSLLLLALHFLLFLPSFLLLLPLNLLLLIQFIIGITEKRTNLSTPNTATLQSSLLHSQQQSLPQIGDWISCRDVMLGNIANDTIEPNPRMDSRFDPNHELDQFLMRVRNVRSFFVPFLDHRKRHCLARI
mmetsp:Transcript_59618/g.94870  ORF Transcript_59618/g.94870 Transcript_59618/m.94870 type:complete len:206 (+) Transcript_59618:220-837(+)